MLKVKVCSSNALWSSKTEPNTIILQKDRWDDFGFKTTYYAFYNGVSLGILNIIKKGQLSGYTINDEGYVEIDDQYCSLGSQIYYEGLMELLATERAEILKTLRDCISDTAIYRIFRNQRAFNVSVLRFLIWENHSKLCKGILDKSYEEQSYNAKIIAIKDDSEIEININSNPNKPLPTNINVLIGRNAVGKTQLLEGIYETHKNPQFRPEFYSEIKLNLEDIEKIVYADLSTDPIDEKLVDLLRKCKPMILDKASETFVNSDREVLKKYLSPTEYIEAIIPNTMKIRVKDKNVEYFKNALTECFSRNDMKQRWIETVEELGSDPIFKEFELHKKDVNEIAHIYNKSSSGHKHVLLIFTQLIKCLSERTLVLIDEPENHLHPPLLSSFVRALSKLLKKRNAIAFIATHSPIVLQEVPKSCVTCLNKAKDGSIETIDLNQETFAENITLLTYRVFNYEVEESGFYNLLKKEVEDGYTLDEILDRFDNQIGHEGISFLVNLLAKKDIG